MAIELDLELITTVDTKDVDRTDDGCHSGKLKLASCGANGGKDAPIGWQPDSPK